VTFKFWEVFKNASELILVPKNIFFLKVLNFVQSFAINKKNEGNKSCRETLDLQTLFCS
jgi:hypothetical protein